MGDRLWRWIAAAGVLPAVVSACTNNPYSEADDQRKILYASFREAPRTLDPAVAYTTSSHAITGEIYETLLEYHYLKRPYVLIPGLAARLPSSEEIDADWTVYRFELRQGVFYQQDFCFGLDREGRTTREVVTADIAFELMRLADPAVNSPVTEPMGNIRGFSEFGQRLSEAREADPGFGARPTREQYAAVGPMEGVRTRGRYALEVEVSSRYPQILYWFAMPFTAPVPWEAVAYYDGEGGRPRFADHPVGTGPYRLAQYDKHARMVLEANPDWYGVVHPEWRAPGTVYPDSGQPGDLEAGLLDPAVVGRPLPFIERIEFRREKEAIPYFNKFLQGYYDAAGVIKESFDKVIHEGGLSDEMRASGISLEKSVEPSVFYIGFNMDDPVVGALAGEAGRKLRQAMSLVIDTEEYTRLFSNGRGVPAQTPLPPGLYGFDPEYRNPFRRVDLEGARGLLSEAGYPEGVDPDTGAPLRLTFDTSDTSAQGRLRFEFFTRAWRELGIDVKVEATNYNQFQAKVRNGAYQIFMWGWVADYPDPENFLFLLWSEMARSKTGGPNTANFSHPRYDELYLSMKARPNDAERLAEIEEMRGILEYERPWIELVHSEAYSLFHGWLSHIKPFGMSFPMTKYRDVDPALRTAQREAWNRPILWPLYIALGLGVVLVVPAVVTFMRERQ
ncbi:MAG: ABC transporter substrate-binding protein [Myxococcota bacterium]|nr:ABC transporter substrate-binding protein [Myxococcota bacterium]